ncbi:MAG: PE domain-containing protein [Mycobacterium sp.]|uniref:PE family protein n=1 Tax=Mycobacterium sp. TaxID=1785 RepID=UPI003F9B63D2
MSFVMAAPEIVTAAATDLANLGSTISAANAAAAIPVTGLLPAAADEVSAQIVALFGAHSQEYQALSARAAAFHAQFVQALNAAAGSYAATEAASVSPLQTVRQDLLGVVKAPTQTLLGHPLIGNGAPGTGGPGPILSGTGALRADITTAEGAPAATGLIGNGAAAGARAVASTAATASPLHLAPRVIQLAASVKTDLANLAGDLNRVANTINLDLLNVGALVALPPQEFPVTGPVQLFNTTSANLQALLADFQADPFPVLSQIITNQMGYAQILGTGLQGTGQALMPILQNLPATLQTANGFLQQGDVFDALTYLYNSTVVSPLINGGLPLLESLNTVLGDITTNISNLGHDGTVLLYLTLLPLPPPTAALTAFAGVSQDIVNAVGSGNYLTALEDVALAPTTILGGALNGYPVTAPFLDIDPSAGLLTGAPGTSQPSFGDGSAGVFLALLSQIAMDLGATA